MTTLGQLASMPLSVDYFNPANWQNSSNKDQLSAALAQIQKYDPNATMVTNPGEEYSNETGTGTRDPTYSLNYDPSKLPALANPALQHAAETGGLREMYTGSQGTGWHLANPNAKATDPLYGDFTTSGNQQLDYTGHDRFIDIMGKLTEGIALGGMGAGAFAALGGGVPGALGSFGLKQGVNAAEGGNFNPMSLTALLSAIPGMDQILPYLNLAQGAYGASKGNVGAGINTVGSLAKMFPTIGGGP